MQNPDPAVRIINSQTLEIRFTPNPNALDNRGAWTKQMLNAFNLNEWQTSENRLDVWAQDKIFRAFIGFRNAGLALQDQPREKLVENATKFMQTLMKLPGFDNPIHIERFGFRLQNCLPYTGAFSELREMYISRYGEITNGVREAMGEDTRLVDVGYALDFECNLGKIHTISGPMERKQLGGFFQERAELPDVAIFYDFDIWTERPGPWKPADLVQFCSDFSKAAWDTNKRINEVITRA